MDERIKQVLSIVFNLPVGKMGENPSPDNVEGWDSLGHMKLVAALEEEFGVQFTDDEVLEIQDFRLIRLVIAEHLKRA